MKDSAFWEEVLSLVQQMLGEGFEVSILPHQGERGLREEALSIREKGAPAAPLIHLKSFSEEALLGSSSAEETARRLIRIYRDMAQPKEPELPDLFGTEAAERIILRLINTERNRELLEEVPHQDFLDLSLICCFLLEPEYFCSGAVLISREHLRMFQIGEERLFRLAFRNTLHLCPAELIALPELIREMGNVPGREEKNEIQEIPVFVLTAQASRIFSKS